MPGTSPFETKVVKLINEYFERTQTPGLAYRLKQSHFYTQYVDVLVDAASKAHYMAIECKSINPTKTRKFYFSSWTTDKKGNHQIDRISEFCRKSQRYGVLAVEIRSGSGGVPNEIYLIPWFHVQYMFDENVKAIDPDVLEGKYPRLVKENGVLNFEYCVHKLRQF